MSSRKGKSVDSLKAVESCLNELASADEDVVREALSAGDNLNNFSGQSFSSLIDFSDPVLIFLDV
ncbi:hypothetical protein KIN20_024567 [Parelaphostrongylus tenuis]|uniref:Uncharacterized protein n=1 Tax=Parelaphostrongylus tenuis TaxID=148309 RepID=A0AAD5QWU0_PARTN|nr:hypothetical protein KIN20_024567 [Parelaphostrongylus tenuis]